MIDYYILCTEQPNDVIVSVGITTDLKIYASQQKKSRSDVIRDLYNGKIIYTAHSWNNFSGYSSGAKVKKVWVSGQQFISTEWNNTKKDNLDKIRKCEY